MNQEIWKQAVGFAYYEVSNKGCVRSITRYRTHWRGGLQLLRGTVLKPILRNGALTVNISEDNEQKIKPIAQLVLETFDGPRPTPERQCCHWDDNPENNAVGNLRWGTAKENCADARRNGRTVLHLGEENHFAKLDASSVKLIRSHSSCGKYGKDIAKQFGVSEACVSLIVNRKTWTHL